MICKHKSTKLNGFKYYYIWWIIQLIISHLFTQLNVQIVLFPAIQISISHLFVLSLNVKQFYYSITPRGPYQGLPIRARVDLRVVAMKGYSAFPKAPVLMEPHHQIIQCHIQDTCRFFGVFFIFNTSEMPSVYSVVFRWTNNKKLVDI